MEHHSFLINILFYLVAAIIMVPLAKRLGMGAVLGYLVAGVVIGPWGLGLIKNVEVILSFSEFGVVLLLFLIGLELEPKRLWLLRRPIFGWGGAQVGVVSAGLCAVAMAFGVDWRTALVGALGLSLSSTAIVLATLGERKLMSTPAGSAGFSILLFQDIAAIPMIALVPLLGGLVTHSGEPGWLRVAKLAAVLAALVIGGRFLVNPILRFIAKTDLREIFTAFALLLVIAICVLMESVGLSMALGTFMAGVLLADSEYRHELISDLEPFKGLLLGLFFIAVGMSIDFGVLLASPGLMAAILFGFLGLKLAIIYGIARAMKLPFQERPVFVVLLAQGGEFAFVVFQAAAGANVFSMQTSSLLIGAVALSMLITPLLLIAVDKFLLPRYANCNTTPMEEISELQTAPVIIAGFGRYGQIISRMLQAQGTVPTLLDHNADQIETARAFGYRVFYGDATRLDLLRTAGAGSAQILVVAVDSVEQSLTIVDIAKAHFPQLQIVARARDVIHWNQLRDRGVVLVERELFEASLKSARSVLELLGQSPAEADLAATRFRQHNIALVEQFYPHYKDRAKVIAVVKQGRLELEQQMAQEREQLTSLRSTGRPREDGKGKLSKKA